LAIAAWAIASGVTGSRTTVAASSPSRVIVTATEERSFVEGLAGMALAQFTAQQAAAVQAPGLPSVSREQRRFVAGLAALTLRQLGAAFGTGPTPMSSSALSSMTVSELRRNDAVLAALPPHARRYVRALESTSYPELAAAFGTGR